MLPIFRPSPRGALTRMTGEKRGGCWRFQQALQCLARTSHSLLFVALSLFSNFRPLSQSLPGPVMFASDTSMSRDTITVR